MPNPPESPSPPFRGEREGPIAQRWEGEVGLSASALESPTSPQPSPPPGAERESLERRLAPTIAFEDVHFAYPGGRQPAHDGLSFAVVAGEKIAEGPPDAMRRDKAVIRAYLGRSAALA